MTAFAYQGSELYCEEVPLAKIAQDVGTPCYIYSRRMLVEGYRALDLRRIAHLICYAMKANANLAILRVFIDEGGLDIVSGVSCSVLCAPGPMPQRIVFAGVGERRRDRGSAPADILLFNVESQQELEASTRWPPNLARARVACG